MPALVAIFGESFRDDLLERGRNVGSQLAQRYGWCLQNCFANSGCGASRESALAGGHLVEDKPEGKQIGAGVKLFAADLFGGKIGRCAERCCRAVWIRACRRRSSICVSVRRCFRTLYEFGDPEVQNLRLAALRNKNVGGLNVAMNDAFLVRGIQAVGNLDGVIDQLMQSAGRAVSCACLDPFAKRHALQQLHNDEGLAVVLAQLVDRADVGVVEGRGGARFALEA